MLDEVLFKVLIIGDSGVGKTSFVQRYTTDNYQGGYKGTVGVDFAKKIIKWSETETVKMQLWDIAGQDRFQCMLRAYCTNANGCVLLIDLTNKNSLVNAMKWKEDLDSKCKLSDGSPIPCLLLANKCDSSKRQISQDEIEEFNQANNFIGWTETSAKKGLMVHDSMTFLIKEMFQCRKGNHAPSSSSINNNSSVNLSANANMKEKERACNCCC